MISYQAIAQALGASPASMNRWLKGVPTARNIGGDGGGSSIALYHLDSVVAAIRSNRKKVLSQIELTGLCDAAGGSDDMNNAGPRARDITSMLTGTESARWQRCQKAFRDGLSYYYFGDERQFDVPRLLRILIVDDNILRHVLTGDREPIPSNVEHWAAFAANFAEQNEVI